MTNIRGKPCYTDVVIQEAYCRLSQVLDFKAIADPRSYFFATIRNLLREHVRRQQVVHILHLADLEGFEAVDPTPSPEIVTGDRREYQRLRTIINDLPAVCRQIFVLRKVECLSQRTVAERLDVTENVVEKRTAQGLRLVLKAWTSPARHRPNDNLEADARRWK
jgi:RNA polymerase sigma factor (sigma-70 family)